MKNASISELGIIAKPGQFIRRRNKRDDAVNIENNPSIITTNATIKIFVEGVQIIAQCGVYSHEIGKDRPLIVDIEVTLNRDIAINEDDLSNTLDYDILVNIAKEVAASKHFYLIETYALNIGQRLLEDKRVESAKIKIEKPNSIKGVKLSGTEIFVQR